MGPRHYCVTMTAGIAARATVLSLAAVLLLAGCTPAVPGSATPSPGSTSTSDSNDPDSQNADGDPTPVPFVDLGCAGLVTSALATSSIVEAVTLQQAVLSQGYLLTDGLPSLHEPATFAARIASGFTCEWSNGQPQVLDVAQNPAYSGFVLDVLPAAASYWAQYQSYLTSYGLGTEYCYKYDKSECDIDTLIDGSWYHLRAYGVTGAGDAAVAATGHAIIAGAAASIAAATPSTDEPADPDGTASLSAECTQFFSDADLATAAGQTLALTVNTDAPVIAVFGAAANLAASIDYCSWHGTANPEFDYDALLVSWLQGGEWAFSQLDAAGAFTGATALTVPGLGANDSAKMLCVDDRCSVDLLVAHDWIWFSVRPAAPTTPTAAATALAAAIVASVNQ